MVVQGDLGSFQVRGRFARVPQRRFVTDVNKFIPMLLKHLLKTKNLGQEFIPWTFVSALEVLRVQNGSIFANICAQKNADKRLTYFNFRLLAFDEGYDVGEGPAGGDAVQVQKVILVLGHGKEGDRAIDDPVDKVLGISWTIQHVGELEKIKLQGNYFVFRKDKIFYYYSFILIFLITKSFSSLKSMDIQSN